MGRPLSTSDLCIEQKRQSTYEAISIYFRAYFNKIQQKYKEKGTNRPKIAL